MPRQPRYIEPGSLQHFIARFVNRDFLLKTDVERAEYLRRAGRSFLSFDWTPLGYALMSSHVHWIFLAGRDPLEGFVKSLHGGFARWLNARVDRIGHVFADRPRTKALGHDSAARLLAYVHNNPVRARVVGEAVESSWTSHRAYVGQAAVPAWLDVSLGLALSGISRADVRSFEELVQSHASEGRIPELSAAPPRDRLRRLVSGSEVGSSEVTLTADPPVVRHILVARGRAGRILRLDIAIDDLIRQVEAICQLRPEALRSRQRTPDVTHGRRVVLLVWVQIMRRPLVAAADELGITSSAASELLRAASERDRGACARAAELAGRLAARATAAAGS